MRKGSEWMKGDERILGDGHFVETVLKEAHERLDQKYRLQAEGYDFEWLVSRVADQLGIEPEEVLAPGKYPQNVRARSLLCYWGVREMGMTTVELSRRLNLSQPGISQSVKRGRKISQNQGIIFIEKDQQEK
jgi:putative transposase